MALTPIERMIDAACGYTPAARPPGGRMLHTTTYLEAVLVTHRATGALVSTYWVLFDRQAAQDDGVLGYVAWLEDWGCYAFLPETAECALHPTYLAEIAAFCQARTAEATNTSP